MPRNIKTVFQKVRDMPVDEELIASWRKTLISKIREAEVATFPVGIRKLLFKPMIIVLIAALFLGGGGGVVMAAQNDLPGDALYGVKLASERVVDAMTVGQAAKARRTVAIAEERLREARTLAARGDENVQRAVELYEEKIAEAAERAENARNADALARVTEATSKHFAVLEDVIAQVPEQAKAAVQRALESSRQGQVSALQALKGEDPSRAVEAGLAAIKAHTERSEVNAGRGRPEDAERAANDFQAVLAVVSDVVRGRPDLAAKFSEELTDVVEELDEAKDATPNIPAPVKEKISQAKGSAIDAQLASLREFVREDPEKAVDIFAKAAEARLNAVKEDTEEGNGADTEESLEDYEKYAQFGQEISTMAQGIRTGETTVEDLVKRATSHHLQVLEDARQKLPPEAQQEFQRAQDAARKVQELRPEIPAPGEPGVQPPQPTQPGAPQAPVEPRTPPEVEQETEVEQRQETEVEQGAPQQIPDGSPQPTPGR
jgi:hypothetical protein